MIGDIYPKGMPACKNAGPGRGADWCTCVEAIKDHAGSGHIVQVGCFDEWMAGVSTIPVTMIIRHNQDDMGKGVFIRRPYYSPGKGKNEK